MNPYGVRPGQIWQGCDPRYPESRIKILMVYEERGYVTAMQIKNARLRRIQLNRFKERSNGYRLIQDVEAS